MRCAGPSNRSVNRTVATGPSPRAPGRFRSMGVALGLGAALSWGLADYFAAVASRRVGALRVVLFMHVAAMVPLTVVVLATGGLAGVSLAELGVLFGFGVVGWLSYLAFYGTLAIGPISVLSAIISGYAAVTVLFAVVLTSEHLSGLQAVAVGATIAGAVSVCLDFGAIAQARKEPRSALGFALALCAMTLIGGFVCLVCRTTALTSAGLHRSFWRAGSRRCSWSATCWPLAGSGRFVHHEGCWESSPCWPCWTPAAMCVSTSGSATPQRQSSRRPRRHTPWCRS